MDRPLSPRPELSLRLEPSRIALCHACAVLALAVLALLLAEMHWLCRLLLSAGLLWLVVRGLREWHQPAVTGLDWSGECWSLQVGGAATEAVLQQPVFLAFGLVSLCFRLSTGQSVRVLLWPDSATAGALRQLRCILLQR